MPFGLLYAAALPAFCVTRQGEKDQLQHQAKDITLDSTLQPTLTIAMPGSSTNTGRQAWYLFVTKVTAAFLQNLPDL